MSAPEWSSEYDDKTSVCGMCDGSGEVMCPACKGSGESTADITQGLSEASAELVFLQAANAVAMQNLESVANMLRGMSMDRQIPQNIRAQMLDRANLIDGIQEKIESPATYL